MVYQPFPQWPFRIIQLKQTFRTWCFRFQGTTIKTLLQKKWKRTHTLETDIFRRHGQSLKSKSAISPFSDAPPILVMAEMQLLLVVEMVPLRVENAWPLGCPKSAPPSHSTLKKILQKRILLEPGQNVSSTILTSWNISRYSMMICWSVVSSTCGKVIQYDVWWYWGNTAGWTIGHVLTPSYMIQPMVINGSDRSDLCWTSSKHVTYVYLESSKWGQMCTLTITLVSLHA